MKDLYTLIEEYGAAENLAGFIEGMLKHGKRQPVSAEDQADLRAKKRTAAQLHKDIVILIGKPE